jgi:sodium-dependent dicarboxylate transporter 2/3/5
MARAVPWSVLVLMGGGFAMADAIQRSGLSHQLARSVAHLGDLPPVLQVLGVCVGISFLSAFTSNTATTQVALPLLGAGAVAAGIDPLAWMVPATISASCDFALAVGTPPNAIAAEAGDVTPGEMAAAGVALNVLCALLATAVTLGPGALALAP